MKILIAEDDPVTHNILEHLVAAWGHDPVTVEDGRAALAALADPLGPPLAILDWEMPELDGPSVCSSLRRPGAVPRARYLILLTGRRDPADVAAGLDAGADDYVVKPFHPVELQARIRVGVRVVELQDTLRERERFQGALEMAGAVCHEFNQPLQVVRGWTELLLEDLAPDDPDCEALRGIEASVERLGYLTQKMMGLTRYRSKPYLSGQSRIIDLNAATGPRPAEGVTW
jgi:CheY-like chemotaxis protein